MVGGGGKGVRGDLEGGPVPVWSCPFPLGPGSFPLAFAISPSPAQHSKDRALDFVLLLSLLFANGRRRGKSKGIS
jgi:hypothetical protein